MLGNIGPMELFIVLVIVLVLFGAKRLPEMGASIGKGIREFKNSLSEVTAPAAVVPPGKSEDTAALQPKRLISQLDSATEASSFDGR